MMPSDFFATSIKTYFCCGESKVLCIGLAWTAERTHGSVRIYSSACAQVVGRRQEISAANS